MVERSTSDDENERVTARLRPNTLGQLFGGIAIIGGCCFLLSFFSVFAYLLIFNPPDGASLPLPIAVLGIGSWACVVISLWGYAIWVTWILRNQPEDSGQSVHRVTDDSNQSEERPRTGFHVLWHTGDQDVYELRQRRRFLAFGFGVLALLAPIAILAGG